MLLALTAAAMWFWCHWSAVSVKTQFQFIIITIYCNTSLSAITIYLRSSITYAVLMDTMLSLP